MPYYVIEQVFESFDDDSLLESKFINKDDALWEVNDVCNELLVYILEIDRAHYVIENEHLWFDTNGLTVDDPGSMADAIDWFNNLSETYTVPQMAYVLVVE